MPKIILFEKSFASHPKSIYWSSRNEDKPDMCALNSHTKYWFNCDKCCHDFEITLLNINQSNNWCPYCYNRKLCNLNNCITCFNKSFASHPKHIYWSELNTCKPIEVIKGSEKKYYFNCDKCHHKLLISLKHISTGGRWCAYCSHQKLCKEDNCTMCLHNSFASVENSKYLYDKTLNPRMLFKSTNKKYNFECNKCLNIFETQLCDITKGVWCPNCYNKTEEKLYNQLKQFYIVKRQFKPLWCKNQSTNKYLPFDFVIEELKIIIEQDGPQHFKQIGNWQSPELTFKNDIYKMNCANQNGYSIIRILQKDIWHNKYDWVQELCDNINKIKYDNRVQNIYMCKNNEYKNFDENLEIPKLCC
jgi:very-short-patch-repair endonuclease